MATVTFQPKTKTDPTEAAAPTAGVTPALFAPDPVEELEDTGLPESLVTAVLLKYLLQVGGTTGRGCAAALCQRP